MNWEELLKVWQLDNIIVTIKNPVRKEKAVGDVYKTGRITGFKTGLWASRINKWQHGGPMHCIKKPKVHVTYNIFDWGGKEHSDWIDFDNCEFTLKN